MDKARRLTAELSGVHVKYKAKRMQAHPGGIICPTKAADLVPFTVNYIRSALDAQEAPVGAIKAVLEALSQSSASRSAPQRPSPGRRRSAPASWPWRPAGVGRPGAVS